MKTRSLALFLAFLLAMTGAIGVFWTRNIHLYPPLPYRDSFAKHKAGEWVPLGGSWSIEHDAMVNRSDEPGSKLITGSSQWTNYQIDADLELRAHGGDIGIILRVSDPEIGINAYRGYYVGLRSQDSALVIGRTDDDWVEGRPIPVNGGVKIGEWYHVKTVVVGCEVAAEARNLTSGETTYAALQDDPANCFPQGRIGLRTTDTSGSWKNVQVKSASLSDLQAIMAQVAEIGRPRYPLREDENSRMRMKYFPAVPRLEDAMAPDAWGGTNAPPVSVSSLQINESASLPARIIGVITFTEPVFLQDASGGVMLQVANPESLNIGDEVEVEGRMVGGGFSPLFRADRIRLLRARTAVLPVSITPTEAATGAHAGTLVEVTGVVDKRMRLANGYIELDLEDPAQLFAATLKGDLFSDVLHEWAPGSTVRVRGICTMNPEDLSGRSFTIMAASASDISVIAGPPWWSGWRLVRIIGLLQLAGAAGFYLFYRFERSKHQAIMQQREDLAHEMHDTLAQSFAGVGYYLQSIRRSLRGVPQLPQEIVQDLDVACDLVTKTHREASASIAALRPDPQNAGDLLSVLQGSACSMLGGERIPITLSQEGNPRLISPKVADVLLNVGREAISNVLRHSQATSMTLRLHFQSRQICLAVEDNGIGFSPNAQNEGFGLQSMRRRCRAVGASLEIRSTPREGCTLTVAAPDRKPRFVAAWLLSCFSLGEVRR
jgi:signal transduction histidine kinase